MVHVKLTFFRAIQAQMASLHRHRQASVSEVIFLPMSHFWSNLTGEKHASSAVHKSLQSGRIVASVVVLQSSETFECNDAIYVVFKLNRTCVTN
jgi:hypothetical protein